MTQIFRQQVSELRRTVEKAVVVLCVDAVNVHGSLLSTIRNYVGGHPILLAVTRCDLLPPYVWERWEREVGQHGGGDDDDDDDDSTNSNHRSPAVLEALEGVYAARAAAVQPAAVYLCSEERAVRSQTGGLRRLAQDLWQHLNGRDVYVVGAANLGKSTLTDLLIAGFLHQGDRLGLWGDRLAQRRFQKLREARVTRSALPGTTLQNVRVPCFARDHTQAVWDTPGLLLDNAAQALFPIRNFKALLARRPRPVVPQVHVVENEEEFRSMALLVWEKRDGAPSWPLLRVEVRLKKDAEGDGPVQLVWNSTLNDAVLESTVVDLRQAREDERRRAAAEQERQAERRREEEERAREKARLTPEERERGKEERRLEHERRETQLREELGEEAYRRHQKREAADRFEEKRRSLLAELVEVHKVVLEGGVGTDICVANFGWLGILLPRTALVRTCAPHPGVRVDSCPTMALPVSFGDYDRVAVEGGEGEVGGAEDDSEEEDDDDDYDDIDERFARLRAPLELRW